MAQGRRMLYVKIWTSEQFGYLSDKAKLLYIGMVTLADDDGLLRGNSLYLRSQIFTYDDITGKDVEQYLNEVIKSGLIEKYTANEETFLQHPKWLEYQHIRKDRMSPSNLPKPIGFKSCQPDDNQVSTKGKVSKDNKSKDSKSGIIKFTAQDMKMTDLLIGLIQQNNPEWKMRGSKDIWAEHIEKLHRIDGRNYEQIEVMIKWTQSDNFWRQNILSTSKLRDKFNDLIPKIKGAYQNKGTKKQVFI